MWNPSIVFSVFGCLDFWGFFGGDNLVVTKGISTLIMILVVTTHMHTHEIFSATAQTIPSL